MNVDFNKTLELLTGGLLNREQTWNSYLGSNPSWQQTAVLLTGPLIVGSVVFTVLLSQMTGGFNPYGPGMGIVPSLLLGLVAAAISYALGSFLLSWLAGVFGGKADFSRSLAAMSLAFIPGVLGGILGALIPWIGFLVALAGYIVSLVFLYKIIPLALEVPDGKRVLHFVVSLVVIFVANIIVSYMLGFGAADRDYRDYGQQAQSGESGYNSSTAGSGMLADMERQSRLWEAAGNDRYDPPADGKVNEDQVEAFVEVMRKTRAVHEKYQQEMEALQKEMEGKEDASFADLAKMASGFSGGMSAQNAEMEIVKTGGGNWAEHNWVREQLHVASLQGGTGSEAIEHNYALYREYEDELGTR
jgi:hypothetical protein